jgi:hypothetical protein
MPMHDRLEAQQRHQVWGELCLAVEHLYELVDEVHEITLRWFDRDPELVDAHHDRCRIRNDEPSAGLPSGSDEDIDF